MDDQLLQEIGLTEGETKVYFALVKLGATKTGPLAKEAGVSSSKVYKILDRLEKKGLAGHVLRGQTKYFNAMPPSRILDYLHAKTDSLSKKEDAVKKLIPQITLAMEKANSFSNAAIYDGFDACTNYFRGILDELHKGDEYCVLGATYGDVKGLREFFHNHHLRRAEKGIKLKMLANYDVKENLESSTKANAEIRFLPQYLITNMEIVFYSNKAFIVLWTNSPVGFLIENEEAVKSFRRYFDAFWKVAKK
jgi:sugar-specific transcriptional regulator TrmB